VNLSKGCLVDVNVCMMLSDGFRMVVIQFGGWTGVPDLGHCVMVRVSKFQGDLMVVGPQPPGNAHQMIYIYIYCIYNIGMGQDLECHVG